MKKSGKKVLSLFMALCMCGSVATAGIASVSAAETQQETAGTVIESGTTGKCTWTLTDTGTLTISGNGPMGDYGWYPSAPWAEAGDVKKAVIGNGVTKIGDYAFSCCESLNSINIPGSVTNIGESAFEFTGFTSFTVPKNVTKIGYGAFWGCEKLKKVSILGNITEISDSTFGDCPALTSISIPNTVKIIRSCAFVDSGLTSVTIPDSVTSIEEGAFSSCAKLTSINLPSSVKSIGFGSFAYSGLKSIKIPASVTDISYYAFKDTKSLEKVEFPSKLKTIQGNAFAGSGLKEAKIPDTVTEIGYRAFDNCKNLKSISLPKNLNKIDDYACGYVMDKNYKSVKVSGFTVNGYKLTPSETYAKKNGFKFVDSWPKTNVATVKLENKSNGIRADWNYVTGASKYIVYYKKSTDKSWKSATTSNLYYPILNTTPGAKYNVQVQSVDAKGVKGKYSAVKTLEYKLLAPTGVTLTNKSNGIRVDWKKSTGAAKYVVYYKKSTDKSWKSATTSNNYYAITGTTAGAKYNVQIQPVASNGAKGYYTSVKKIEFKLMATTVTLSNKSNGIRAEWKKVPGAASYIVYYRNSNTSTWSKATTKNLYYPILNIKKGDNYCVQVQAVASNGAKGYYSPVSRLTYK